DKFGDDDMDPHVLDGKGYKDRAEATGYDHSGVAENAVRLLKDVDLAARAVEGWKKSPGHRENLLKPFKELGVGAAKSASGRWYLVQIFGSPKDAPAFS